MGAFLCRAPLFPVSLRWRGIEGVRSRRRGMDRVGSGKAIFRVAGSGARHSFQGICKLLASHGGFGCRGKCVAAFPHDL